MHTFLNLRFAKCWGFSQWRLTGMNKTVHVISNVYMGRVVKGRGSLVIKIFKCPPQSVCERLSLISSLSASTSYPSQFVMTFQTTEHLSFLGYSQIQAQASDLHINWFHKIYSVWWRFDDQQKQKKRFWSPLFWKKSSAKLQLWRWSWYPCSPFFLSYAINFLCF